jgi:hypothetical protein
MSQAAHECYEASRRHKTLGLMRLDQMSAQGESQAIQVFTGSSAVTSKVAGADSRRKQLQGEIGETRPASGVKATTQPDLTFSFSPGP